jgi:A/G-specific adenine glycosylase
MLQQTQASRVAPAFEVFMGCFPSVEALAGAARADVLRAWGSLGYNRRAVALSEAARAIVRRHGGRVPADPVELARLPGVGPYTAAAIASLAFGAAVPAIDVNVTRVVARARIGRDGAPEREVEEAAASWMAGAESGRWNQAVMDIGREVCRPRPRCDACPLRSRCRFRLTGALPEHRPRKQSAFPGSFRQVRGAVVRTLRSSLVATVAGLARETGHPHQRLVDAVRALAADGVVRAGPAALAGRAGGRVRLAP